MGRSRSWAPVPATAGKPISEEVVGGKQVVAVTSALGYHYYFYASGDVLYTVSVLDASIAAQVLAALPPP